MAVEKDVALAAHEAELRRIVDAEWTLRTRIRIAWAQWAAAHERVALLQDVVARADHIASISDRLSAAAELTRVEARLIRAQVASLRADLAAAERDEAAARIGLLGLMGFPPGADIRLVHDLPPTLAEHTENEIDRLITANTTLAVARAEYQVAEQALRLEIRKQYPDLTIGSGYGSEDDQRLLLGASLPIPVLNANRAGIAEAAARRDLARATAEVTFERLTQELALARASLSAAERRRQAFESELVPMMDEQIREIQRLAELGEVDTLLLLETLTRGFDVRNELLELRIAEISAAATITRLLGPDSVASPATIAEPTTDHPSDSPPLTNTQETQQ